MRYLCILQTLTAASLQILIETAQQVDRTAQTSRQIRILWPTSTILPNTKQHPSGLRSFLIRADHLHERAAGAIEEIGFALSAAVDFIAEMQERGLETDRIARITFLLLCDRAGVLRSDC